MLISNERNKKIRGVRDINIQKKSEIFGFSYSRLSWGYDYRATNNL